MIATAPAGRRPTGRQDQLAAALGRTASRHSADHDVQAAFAAGRPVVAITIIGLDRVAPHGADEHHGTVAADAAPVAATVAGVGWPERAILLLVARPDEWTTPFGALLRAERAR